MLLSGWENGEIHAWINGKREFVPIQGSGFHKSPIMLIEFSEKGGRLVTADSVRHFLFVSLFGYYRNKFLFRTEHLPAGDVISKDNF